MCKRMSTHSRNPAFAADSLRRGRANGRRQLTLPLRRPFVSTLRLAPNRRARNRSVSCVANFEDVATKPCAHSFERKSMRAKTIRRRSSSQVMKRGVLSPKTRFATKVLCDKTPAHQRSLFGSPPPFPIHHFYSRTSSFTTAPPLAPPSSPLSRPRTSATRNPNRKSPPPLLLGVLCLGGTSFLSTRNSLPHDPLPPFTQPVVGRYQQQYNGPLGSPPASASCRQDAAA